MAESDMPLGELLEHLLGLANASLSFWGLPDDATARLINVSENATYLVEAPGGHKSILRVHRENYHTRRAIECELAWLDALSAESIVTTPGYYTGKNGSVIQEARADGLADPRFLVLFKFVEGEAPDESGDMSAGYENLGAIAAKCHLHAISWDKPEPFERLIWDVDAVFGASPTWGNWRDAPEVTEDVCDVLERVETTIRERLAAYGKSPERYNLIHADMRLANLLVDDNGTRLIDFDDCGFGWFGYDFAAAISFIELDPIIPALKEAWIEGYRTVAPFSASDAAMLDSFVMLRRLLLTAWIASHPETPTAQEMGTGFTAGTLQMAQDYLTAEGAK